MNYTKHQQDNSQKQQSRDIALLVIATFLVAVYFLKDFYTPEEPARVAPFSPIEQTVFEVEDADGDSRVYVLPEEKSGVKTGSKITINKDGTADTGLMSGEKHLIFAITLNINEATAKDLEALPGIGPKLSERVVETRNRLGGFKTIEDIKKVKGIGEKKFEKMKRMISVE